MIRRQSDDQFLLFTQHDHALLSGQLASCYGNSRFSPPTHREAVIRAITLHDCGWPLHDDQPTLNQENLPLDVFETPLSLAVRVWQASADRIASEDPYTQLLVSLHVLGLSGFAASHAHTRVEQFDLNKFQHREIERQEDLRRRIGLSTDIPLKLGLAQLGRSEAEDQLRRNYILLQAMDRISLNLCSTEVIFPSMENFLTRPGAAPVTLHFLRTSSTSLKVEPWPFNQPEIPLEITCRPVPRRPFLNLADFRSVYAAATAGVLEFTIHSS